MLLQLFRKLKITMYNVFPSATLQQQKDCRQYTEPLSKMKTVISISATYLANVFAPSHHGNTLGEGRKGSALYLHGPLPLSLRRSSKQAGCLIELNCFTPGSRVQACKHCLSHPQSTDPHPNGSQPVHSPPRTIPHFLLSHP